MKLKNIILISLLITIAIIISGCSITTIATLEPNATELENELRSFQNKPFRKLLETYPLIAQKMNQKNDGSDLLVCTVSEVPDLVIRNILRRIDGSQKTRIERYSQSLTRYYIIFHVDQGILTKVYFKVENSHK